MEACEMNDVIPNYDDTGWPMVVPNDDGIRPAGPEDACFYCGQKVGTAHRRDCTIVTKKVKVAYRFELEATVPHDWTEEDLLFHRNDGSWCADNALDELVALGERHGCTCNFIKATSITVVDPTPTRATRSEQEVETDRAMRRECNLDGGVR